MSLRNLKTKNKLTKFLTTTAALALSLAFIIGFAGSNILKQYISYGIGNCKAIPILCMQPEEKIVTPDELDVSGFITQSSPKLAISVPRGFDLVQELIKKNYYKKKNTYNKAVIYLLAQRPDDFLKLYPDVRKQGVGDNQEFIKRVMYATLNKVNNVTDAFFVVMKSIFIPDVGNQNIAKMIRFRIGDKTGYINYTMTKVNNFFDCNVLDSQGNFFKVYIKDIGARLDLNKVFAIISTVKPLGS